MPNIAEFHRILKLHITGELADYCLCLASISGFSYKYPMSPLQFTQHWPSSFSRTLILFGGFFHCYSHTETGTAETKQSGCVDWNCGDKTVWLCGLELRRQNSLVV